MSCRRGRTSYTAETEAMQNGAHSRWTVAYAEALFGDGACILKRVSGDAAFLRIGANTDDPGEFLFLRGIELAIAPGTWAVLKSFHAFSIVALDGIAQRLALDPSSLRGSGKTHAFKRVGKAKKPLYLARRGIAARHRS
jgi:hypothetical protein